MLSEGKIKSIIYSYIFLSLPERSFPCAIRLSMIVFMCDTYASIFSLSYLEFQTGIINSVLVFPLNNMHCHP